MTRREFHTATLLTNGKILIAGRWQINLPSAGTLPSAELYDPVGGTFAVAAIMASTRYGHTATMLPNGQLPSWAAAARPNASCRAL
jgi:hypothetical protein